MPPHFTLDNALAQLRGWGKWRTERVLAIMAEPPPDQLSGELVIALFSRETDLRNVEGPTYIVRGVEARDKGLGQWSSYWNRAWLDSIKGADPGSYDKKYPSALPLGRVPAGLEVQVKKLRSQLRYALTRCQTRGVPERDQLAVALVGHNAGTETAINAYLAGTVPDSITTGGNYSTDILQRRTMFRRARRELGWRA